MQRTAVVKAGEKGIEVVIRDFDPANVGQDKVCRIQLKHKGDKQQLIVAGVLVEVAFIKRAGNGRHAS